MATVWRLAFEDLEQTTPAAVGLLRLLAFCAPEAIPLRLLLQPRPDLAGELGERVAPVLTPLLEDSLAAGDAVAALRRYSLVTPAAERSVSVHRLVQAVTADQMPADLAGQWRQAAATLIEAAIPADPGLPATWPTCAALLPHAQATLDLTSSGMWRIARYLGESGSYPAARDLFQLIADARAEGGAYGLEHPDTLATRGSLAYWTGQAGDPVAARDQFAALLSVEERVLGPEHPDTLAARGNLARWTGLAGDAAAARDQYAALMSERTRVLGPGHPYTVADRSNLAYWTGEAGDAADARDQYAALVPVVERMSGPEHPDTLAARSNLANWTGKAGDAVAARDQYTALLPVRARILGPEHPEIVADRSNLAYWTGEAGDAVAARDQLAALLPVVERVFGPEHPNTLTVQNNLAYITEQAKTAASW